MINKNGLLSKMVKCGHNQKTLAFAVGMSKNTLNSKINGRGVFDTEEIRKICDVLNIKDNREKADIFLAESSQK